MVTLHYSVILNVFISEKLERHIIFQGDKAESYAAKGANAHNIFRRIHQSRDISVDSDLTKDAESYAKELVKIGHLQHDSTLKGIGENIAFECKPGKPGFVLSAADATKLW